VIGASFGWVIDAATALDVLRARRDHARSTPDTAR